MLNSGYPIVVFSGCGWHDTGGGQRPVQLSRRWRSAGHEVYYYGEQNARTAETREGVVLVGRHDLVRALPDLEMSEGLAVVALPAYFPAAKLLHDAGWVVVYDLLDDWEAFVRAGVHESSFTEQEGELFELADLVTVTAPVLGDYAGRHGRESLLVRNGGPEGAVEGSWRRSRAAYTGSIVCSWYDWGCMESLTESGVDVTVIGDYGQLDPASNPRMHYTGELPYEVSLQLLAQHSVGVIPLRGELCHGVDPIKYYDYQAAGLWSIHTPDLWDMAGRPGSTCASPTDFGEATKHTLRFYDPSTDVDDAWLQRVAENSWSVRARQLLESVGRLEPRQQFTVAAAVEVDESVPPRSPEEVDEGDEWGLRLTVSLPLSCDMAPPCPYCCTREALDAVSESVPGGLERWRAALNELAEAHGRLYVSFCFGEPMSSLNITMWMSELAEAGHRVDVVSNIIADLDWFRHLALQSGSGIGNIGIATSFHPHYWGRSSRGLVDFIEKRYEIEKLGLRCGTTIIVAYPPNLSMLPEWLATLAAADIHVDVIPFEGEWGGRRYPQGYSEEQRAFLEGLVGDIFGARHKEQPWQPTTGKLCRAGKDYLVLGRDGEGLRCPAGGSLGNIFNGGIHMLDEAQPCQFERCTCPGMWGYILDEPDAPVVESSETARVLRSIEPAVMYRRMHEAQLPEDLPEFLEAMCQAPAAGG